MSKNKEPLRPAPTEEELQDAARAASASTQAEAVTFAYGDSFYQVIAPQWRDDKNRIVTREDVLGMPAEQERLVAIGSGVIKKIEKVEA